jgi:hypothetical protein
MASGLFACYLSNRTVIAAAKERTRIRISIRRRRGIVCLPGRMRAADLFALKLTLLIAGVAPAQDVFSGGGSGSAAPTTYSDRSSARRFSQALLS